MNIIPITNPSELKKFVLFPYHHYQDDPMWVAPLRGEQWAQYDHQKNPMLDHCQYQLFVASDGGHVVGRIAAFIDQLALDHWREPIGLFGSYECIQNPDASRLLLNAAQDWLKAKGMTRMRGPWSFASQEWGLVVEGFEPRPVILAPYNPGYYNEQLQTFGLEKAMDLLVYLADMKQGYQIPERILRLTDRVQQRYGVHVRPVAMDKLEEDVTTIMHLANESIADNWGFYPVTDAEARAMARDLKQVINPRAVLLAETASGEPVGFAISLPDINAILQGLNGRLMPFGWMKLLTRLPRLSHYRMWALGVIPAYQGRAIDTLLYRATYEALGGKNVTMEINYVLESNDRMNNALLKLAVKPFRRYRVYEKDILSETPPG